MIAPLCGNGMAIAIHAGKIAGELGAEFCNEKITREQLEQRYTERWNALFANRLKTGRTVQRLFGHALLSETAVKIALYSKTISRLIMRQTHGEVF
jgi:flavin-dependent dehydrogenase